LAVGKTAKPFLFSAKSQKKYRAKHRKSLPNQHLPRFFKKARNLLAYVSISILKPKGSHNA